MKAIQRLQGMVVIIRINSFCSIHFKNTYANSAKVKNKLFQEIQSKLKIHVKQ